MKNLNDKSSTKFCTTCQAYRPLAGGVSKEARYRGWRCKECAEHKSESIYKSKGRARDILRKLNKAAENMGQDL